MLLSVVFSVTLLGSTMGSPGGNPTVVTGIVAGLTEACMDGVRHTVAQEISSGQNLSIQETKTGQQKTLQEIRRHQEKTVQEIRIHHEKISSGQQRMQEQLTELQEQLTALQPAPKNCPAGWSHHEDNCYLIAPGNTSWYLAHHACAVMDCRARLASVHLASSRHIQELVAASGTERVWLGLVRLADDVDASWVWSDGTPLDYTNWARGEPNNWQGVIENCGQMSGPRYGGPRGWNDYTCSSANNFICQIGLA